MKELLELCDIARNVASLKLNERILLLDFALSPGTSAYNVAKPMVGRSARSPNHHPYKDYIKYRKSQYRNTKNQASRLTKLKLIEKIVDQHSVHRAKLYQLTVYGVYSILAKEYLSSVIIEALIGNYGNHPFFQYFVYPWMRRDTLLNITDDAIFSQLSSYLRDCCAAVKDTIDDIDEPECLFIWQDVRTGSDDAKALSEFLAQKFGGNWLDDAEIQKSNSKVIGVRAGSHSALITLSDDRKKATVSYKGKKQFELVVVKLFNKLTVQKPPRQLDKTYMDSFMMTHGQRVQRLIFSIISDHSMELDAMKILAQDEILWRIIQDTKNQFDQRYELLEEAKR